MAAFSRKHYQIIAAAIAARRTDGPAVATRDKWTLDALVEDLSAVFAQDNPRFDADRFARAAGVTDSYTTPGAEVV